MVTVTRAEITTDAIEVFGDVGYQWGAYDQVVAVHDQPPADYHGRLVAEWRREADGGWRIRRLLVQPSPPPVKHG